MKPFCALGLKDALFVPTSCDSTQVTVKANGPPVEVYTNNGIEMQGTEWKLVLTIGNEFLFSEHTEEGSFYPN